jgi:hypothetical protein
MKFGLRTPSLKKRIAARTSWKRVVSHSLGFKAPRGWGWLTNPKKAAYNRIYNRTSFSVDSLFKGSRRGTAASRSGSGGVLVILVGAMILGLGWLCSPSDSERSNSPAAVVPPQPRPKPAAFKPAAKAPPTALLGVACKLRSAASGSSEVIGKLQAGQSVEVVDVEKSWLRIRVDSREGWIRDRCTVRVGDAR